MSDLPRKPAPDSTMQAICNGLTRFRAVARGQPITVSVLVLGFGYLLGHLAVPRRRR